MQFVKARTDPANAQQAFELFAPHVVARRQLEEFLSDSIRHAHEESSDCWELTLRPRELVFNVGQVALLIVRPQNLSVYFRWAPAAKSLTRASQASGDSKNAVDAASRMLDPPLERTPKTPAG